MHYDMQQNCTKNSQKSPKVTLITEFMRSTVNQVSIFEVVGCYASRAWEHFVQVFGDGRGARDEAQNSRLLSPLKNSIIFKKKILAV